MPWPIVALTYILLWWLVLFMLLPLGVKTPQNPALGHDPGAPEKPHHAAKFAAATLLAGGLTWAVAAFVQSGLITME